MIAETAVDIAHGACRRIMDDGGAPPDFGNCFAQHECRRLVGRHVQRRCVKGFQLGYIHGSRRNTGR